MSKLEKSTEPTPELPPAGPFPPEPDFFEKIEILRSGLKIF